MSRTLAKGLEESYSGDDLATLFLSSANATIMQKKEISIP